MLKHVYLETVKFEMMLIPVYYQKKVKSDINFISVAMETEEMSPGRVTGLGEISRWVIFTGLSDEAVRDKIKAS